MMKYQYTLLIFAAVFLSSVIGDSIIYTYLRDEPTECDEFFNSLTNKSYSGTNFSKETGYMLLYSAHSLVDLGLYTLCSQTPSQRYSLLDLEGIGLGFCGPSFCSNAQLQEYTDTILEILSNATQYNLTTNSISVQVIDPDDTGTTEGFWLFFTLILYSALIGLVIAGTFIAWQKRRKAKLQYTFVSNDSVVRDHLNLQGDNSSAFMNSGIFKSHIEPRPVEAPTPTTKAPIYIRIIQCFDIAENFEALFKDEKVPGHDQNLNVTAGIRALSFCWVVYGHTFMEAILSKNFTFVLSFEQSPWYLIVIAALYAVDTFFYLSGFFTGFLMVKKLKNMPMSFKSFGLVVFHRWIRLWPAYFVCILFYWKISVYLGNGPLWPAYVTAANYCNSNAWTNFLLLDNVLAGNFDYYCFGWGWYLSCDFQMFLLAPFICWIYLKDRKRSQIVLTVLMMVSLCASYAYASDVGYTFVANKGTQSGSDFEIAYYINPIVRMSPYLVGIWFGFMFKEYKEGEANFFTTLKKSYHKSLICSLSGLAILLILTFVPRMLQTGTVWSDGFARTWSTFSRPGWVIGIFMITAPCLVGNLKGLSQFLGNFYFTLIARLSYTGYLIHLVFLQMFYEGMTQYYGGSQLYQALLALAICFVALFGAVVVHLLVEKPITNIEANILNRKKAGSTVLGQRSVKTIKA